MKFRPDPSFRYTASYNTDLRKTFARIRAGQRQEAGTAGGAAADAGPFVRAAAPGAMVKQGELRQHEP